MNLKSGLSITLILLSSVLFVNAQTFVNTAFKGGEKLTYTISYSMSGLMTDMAQAVMFVKPVKYQGQNLYKLNLTASTYSSWDSYFRARDLYQSWVNPKTGQPYFYNRDIDEGGYKIKVRYVFSRKKGIASSKMQRNNGSIVKKTVKISNSTYDLISGAYAIRNFDFAHDKIGTRHKIEVLIDNKITIIYAKYLGKQTINVAGMGKKECYKVGISLKEEKIMKNNANNNIWLTADANKVPVLMKAVIPVGNIQVRLKSYSGLRH